MRFSIDRDAFLSPLQKVSGAVERRSTLPVLANVLCVVEDDKLSLTATDLELELMASVPLEAAAEAGETTIPARKLLDIVRSVPSGQSLDIRLQENRVKIKTGSSQFTLSTLPAAEFPNVEEMTAAREVSLSQLQLKSLIESTQFAMAQQDVRYYLNGLLLEINPQSLTAVATDGHRLAVAKNEATTSETEKTQAILPRKAVLELARLLAQDEQAVSVTLSSNHLRLAIEHLTFTSKLVDGRFPDYDRVIPKSADKQLIAEREPLKEALSQAAILCNEKFRGVRLQILPNYLKVVANNPEQEEAEVGVSVDYSGSEIEIGFNVAYLLDVLNTLKGDKVRLSFTDANSSLLVEEVDGVDACYVIMPMKL